MSETVSPATPVAVSPAPFPESNGAGPGIDGTAHSPEPEEIHMGDIPIVGPVADEDLPDLSAPEASTEAAPEPPPAFEIVASAAAAAPMPREVTFEVTGEAGTMRTTLTAGAVHEANAARAVATSERLIHRLRNEIQGGLPADVQKEVAALIALISDMAVQEFNEYFVEIEVAVSALTAPKPNLVLAKQIRKQVRNRTNLLLRPVLFLRSGHPAIQVILGLGTNLYFLIPIAAFVVPQWLAGRGPAGNAIPDAVQLTMLWVAIAGAIGSIVSILVRIQDFDNQAVEHRAILFFTGFFKPLVGIASALFVMAIFEAGLIPLSFVGPEAVGREQFFYVALAFVAGFSERLAGDIVAKAEDRVKNAASAPPPAAQG